ncbi:MAG: hypothetical protein IGR92_17535 [Leptolyngbyaceae cyanobacterium T60_A2020_046]|nr:hypothetical protein [Leptolyngbyaceae cyanobacterium T60_A2020_046]
MSTISMVNWCSEWGKASRVTADGLSRGRVARRSRSGTIRIDVSPHGKKGEVFGTLFRRSRVVKMGAQ